MRSCRIGVATHACRAALSVVWFFPSPCITDSQGHSGVALSSSGTHLHSRLTALGHARLPRYAVFFYSRDYSFFVLYMVYNTHALSRAACRHAEVYSSTAVYSGLQYTALQRSTVYSGLHSPSERRPAKESRRDAPNTEESPAIAHHPLAKVGRGSGIGRTS